jgi:TIR domain/CobQ/CobB/MinD/ParA nucleotide binding domain
VTTKAPGVGEVVTFYSYKGGTGRSMMLANVAWILASSGKRVLAIDWDLEAPGLHRYFQPFLLDPDLAETGGVIDFVTDFAVAALTPEAEESGPDWFHPYADVSRYAVPLQWEFDRGGSLEFVAAGRQGSSYSTRVNGFRWNDFYERFGGGAFLEQTKAAAKARYDYVLIDSRTGVSDTSGICTIQLPDTLVVCFTMNNQSVEGTAGVAATVAAKRVDMRILPIPMRIENSEKDRLELRRARARRRFTEVLGVIDRSNDPEQYWAEAEVLYVPYYAYEEILAPFADPIGSPLTMLAACERLTGRLTNGEINRSVRVSDARRVQILSAYAGTPTPQLPTVVSGQYVYLSYRRADAGYAGRIYEELVQALGPERIVIDVDKLTPGVDFVEAIEDAVTSSAVVVALIGPDWGGEAGVSEYMQLELATALTTPGIRVIPALVGGGLIPDATMLPEMLRPILRRQAIELTDSRWTYDIGRLRATVELAIAGAGASPVAPAADAKQYTPSQGSADVIDSVLMGPKRSAWSEIRALAEREPGAVGALVASILPLLVLLGGVAIDTVALAALVVATNTIVGFGLRLMMTPASPTTASAEARARSAR